MLESLGIFPFFYRWQAEFSKICRGRISNKTSASDFNGEYIINLAVLYALSSQIFVLFPAYVDMFSSKATVNSLT